MNVDNIKSYYDNHIDGKLKGFVNGNERVERAWQNMIDSIQEPKKILEVGCGIGDISFRMSEYWKSATVVGLDISERSIEIANKLFAKDKISFIAGMLDDKKIKGKFDLILLMDVYEHIGQNERKSFNNDLNNLLEENGRVFLACPTPRHQQYLKEFNPSGLQPIDEDITLEVMLNLARDMNRLVLMYKQISVWRAGDYCHTIIGNQPEFDYHSDKPTKQLISVKTEIKKRISNKVLRKKESDKIVKFRKDLIEKKLGIEFLNFL